MKIKNHNKFPILIFKFYRLSLNINQKVFFQVTIEIYDLLNYKIRKFPL